MSGIILLSIIAVWFYVVNKVSQLCVRKVQKGYREKVVYVVVFSLLFMAPVADEVVGGGQFWYWCQSKAVSVFDEKAAYGKTVYLKSAEVEELSNTILPTSNFTGHSLGGFLSTLASYKYHSSVGQSYTFNGLGVDLGDYINNEILNSISLNGKLNNYYADLVGSVVGYHPGPKTNREKGTHLFLI
jgi:hypothetical protein